MLYDLNFWQEPDWQQESSVDPNFLIVVGFCVLVMLAGILLLFSLLEVQSRRTDINNLEFAVEQKRPAATEVERQQACIQLWKRALASLEEQSQRRIVWCRQLAALQSLVPGSITLERVSLDTMNMKAVAPGTRNPAAGRSVPQEISLTQYTMTITGVARGDNSEKLITAFSRALPTQSELSPYLTSVELTSVVPEPQTGERQGPSGKEFVIICRYKPFQMDYADN